MLVSQAKLWRSSRLLTQAPQTIRSVPGKGLRLLSTTPQGQGNANNGVKSTRMGGYDLFKISALGFMAFYGLTISLTKAKFGDIERTVDSMGGKFSSRSDELSAGLDTIDGKVEILRRIIQERPEGLNAQKEKKEAIE